MAIQASAEQQSALLDLQQHDTTLLQLAHRRSALPQIAQVQDLEAQLGSFQLKLVAIKTEISDISLAQAKADNDVSQVVQRAERDQQRLDSGAVTSSKDLEALQHEMVSLRKRQTELEDVELEIMEQLEEARTVQVGIEAQVAATSTELEQATQSRDDEFADIDALIAIEMVKQIICHFFKSNNKNRIKIKKKTSIHRDDDSGSTRPPHKRCQM